MQPSNPTPAPQAAPPDKSSKKTRSLDTLRAVVSTLGVVVAALTIAFCLTVFVFQSYQVDGPSMENTLHNNDRLIIWKFPRTWARITRHQYIPHRGDIIVFSEPGLVAADGSTKQLIKRVIALPGERVVVKGATVTVYNQDHPNGFHPDTTLPYGTEGLNVAAIPGEDVDTTVGPNEVFVMGDNRDNSLDSRVFGPIDTSNIVGKLLLRIYPLNGSSRF